MGKAKNGPADESATTMTTMYAAAKVIDEAQQLDDEQKDMRKEFGFVAENNRQWLFVMLDEPDSSMGARLTSLAILALIMLSCVTFVLETMPHFKAGHCEDRCESQATSAECVATASGLCAWVVHRDGDESAVDGVGECLSYAGRARELRWNEVDTRTGKGGFMLDKRTLALNLDFPLADIHQCSDTPEIDGGFYSGLDYEPTEADERICKDLTDFAVVDDGYTVLEGVMKDICTFRQTSAGHMLKMFEYICISVFSVEYVLRMATCTQRPREDQGFCSYVVKPMNLVDLLSIIPFYAELVLDESNSLAVLRILRMSRIFRVLKVGNYMHELHLFVEGYKRSRDGLVLLLCMLMLYLCVFGSVLFLIEYPQQTIDCFDGCNHAECYAKFNTGLSGEYVNWGMLVDCEESMSLEWTVVRDEEPGFTVYASDNATRAEEQLTAQNTTCEECCPSCVHRGFTSITTTWYFILATMTTVGYGDHYPATVFGKFVTFLCMCCGILVVALPIIVIGNAFEEVFLQEVHPPARPPARTPAPHASPCSNRSIKRPHRARVLTLKSA